MSCSYTVLICRCSATTGPASTTENPKKCSRSLAANSAPRDGGPDRSGGTSESTASLPRFSPSALKKGANSVVAAVVRRANSDVTNGSNWFAVITDVMPLWDRRFGRREAVAIPVFAPRVRLAHEEELLRVAARHQHEDGVLLVDAGEIEQVALLPEFVIDVGREHPCGRTPEDRDRVRTEALGDARPARFQVVLEWTRTDQAGERQAEQHEGCRKQSISKMHDWRAFYQKGRRLPAARRCSPVTAGAFPPLRRIFPVNNGGGHEH